MSVSDVSNAYGVSERAVDLADKMTEAAGNPVFAT